jgi:spore cortex biosynthesis protein YabQ
LNVTLTWQLQGFLISIAAGFFLGAFYDVFRIFRTVFQSERRAVFYQDLFYMVAIAFVTFLVALGVNYGDVRFYILAGEGIGWCFYFLTVGFVTLQVFRFLAKIVKKYIISPIQWVNSKISHFIVQMTGTIVKNIKILAAIPKKRLKHCHSIVYNQCIGKVRERVKQKGGGSAK